MDEAPKAASDRNATWDEEGNVAPASDHPPTTGLPTGGPLRLSPAAIIDDRPVLDIADAVMLLVVAIWAVNNVAVKSALDELSPLAYVGARFIIVVVLIVVWLGVRRELRPIRRDDLPALIVSGLTGYAAYNVLFTIGLDRTSAFSVAILISLGPIFTLLMAVALGMERVRPVQWAGVICATVGVGIFVGDKVVAGAPAGGDLLSLFAAIAFSVYSLATRSLVRHYGAPAATAWSALVGLVAVLPWAVPAMAAQDWSALSLGAWGSLLYASAISMLAA